MGSRSWPPPPGPTRASDASTWTDPKGSCTACHSRHDFSPRRARQPENCGKCHLGPDHPQKEIYEESKHGIAYRDLKEDMNLEATDWILGEAYAAAPTCATCHMSGNLRNGGRITHDPGERISWTNRPPVSVAMDTDINHGIVTATDPEARRTLTARYLDAEAGPDEGGVQPLPHRRLRQLLLQPVRRPRRPLQREVRQTRPGHHGRPPGERPPDPHRVRRGDRVVLVLPLAPRGEEGPPRRLHDGSGLHPLAWDVRGGGTVLHGGDSHGSGDHRPRPVHGARGEPPGP